MPTGVYKRKPLTAEWKRKIKENHARYWLGKKRPPHSEEVRKKISESNKKAKQIEHLNPCWKGDNVGITAIHNWVEKHNGKPSKCEHCGREDAKKYEWANIDHNYRRKLNDYVRLCTKCHHDYDKKTFGIHSINKVGQFIN